MRFYALAYRNYARYPGNSPQAFFIALLGNTCPVRALILNGWTSYCAV